MACRKIWLSSFGIQPRSGVGLFSSLNCQNASTTVFPRFYVEESPTPAF